MHKYRSHFLQFRQTTFGSPQIVTFNMPKILLKQLQLLPVLSLIVSKINNVVRKVGSFYTSKLVSLYRPMLPHILH